MRLLRMYEMKPLRVSDTCWLNAPPGTNLGPPVKSCRMPQATPGGVWAWRVTGVCRCNKMRRGYEYLEAGPFIHNHGASAELQRAVDAQSTLGSTLYVELEVWSCYEITPNGRKVWRHGTISRDQFKTLP